MRENTISAILEHKIIAIARGVTPQWVPELAKALYAGGVRLLELTFDPSRPKNWEDTAAGIAQVASACNGEILVGAGTVLTAEQVRLAAAAGARYIISPNADKAVIEMTRTLGLVSIPGVLTPTECVYAHNLGADFCKIFPVGVLGAGYIKALAAPLSHLRFLAVGGVDAHNAAQFIAQGAVGLGVGGNLVRLSLLETGRADEITAAAREIVAAIGG
jgi:2-dehydro-3-deoxyphosphogluconate aldolase/(4S)-4-hydroxy-2-oxoglutarate aldolase